MIRIACEPEWQSLELELADKELTMRTLTVNRGDSSLLTAALSPGRYSVIFRFSPSLEEEDDDDADETDCDEPYLRLHFYLKPKTSMAKMTDEELSDSQEGYPDLSNLQDSLDTFNVATISLINYHINLSSLQETQLQVLKSWPLRIPKPSDIEESEGLTGLFKLTLTLRKR